MTAEEIKKQMEANSAAWHNADETEKQRLHAENQSLASQLGNMSYNSASGKWSENTNTSGTRVSSTGTTKTASGSSGNYTPMNATSAAGINWDNYVNALDTQRSYAAANPTAAQGYTADEFNTKYADIISKTPTSGTYTKDYDAAMAANKAYGVNVTPTEYNGESGWYYVDSNKNNRTAVNGSSNADEDLLNDQEYAVIQSLKNDYAAAQEQYNYAVSMGNMELAAQAQAAMDQAHLDAERIRANYSYSGGTDGSMYLTYGALADNSALRTAAGSGGTSASNPYAAALAGSGSGSSGSSYGSYSSGGTGDDLSSYLEQMYAAKTDAAIAELEAAYLKNVASLDNAEAGLAESYQNARNQTAGASELAARNFNEYAAAYGLNSGTGGQAELARNVTLQNNLNGLNTEEANAYADLELARTNAETEYNLAIAQAQAEGQYELASALYQEKVRVQELMASQQEAILSSSYSGSGSSSGSGTTDTGMTLTTAKQSANAGVFNDAVLQTLYNNGYTDDMIAGIYGYTGGTSTGTGTGTTTTSTATKTSYNNGGLDSNTVKTLQSYFGLTADGYWGPNSQKTTGYSSAADALAAYQKATSSTSSGYNSAYFSAAMTSLANTLASGNTAAAVSGIDSFWNKLNSSQQSQVQSLLSKYGYQYQGG